MSARSDTDRSASQAVKGGEGLELAELLVQISRGRADDEAVNALGGGASRSRPHGLRHSHATELGGAGVPLHVIAGQLDHASTATTDAYLSKFMPSHRIAALRAAGWTLD